MDDQTKIKLSTRTMIAQALGSHDPVTKAIVQPIHMSATCHIPVGDMAVF